MNSFCDPSLDLPTESSVKECVHNDISLPVFQSTRKTNLMRFCSLLYQLKGTKTRKAASPESEPNFYTMAPMPSNKKSLLATLSSAATAPGARSVFSASSTSLERGGRPEALTLQKMAPSFLCPATFETTVHRMLPQLQYPQHPRGLTVTSTCPVTVKPTEDTSVGGGNGVKFAFPFSALACAPSSQWSVPTRTTTNNDKFWAALSGGAAIPSALRDLGENNTAKNNGTSLWLLR
jgi:hypothetical protein